VTAPYTIVHLGPSDIGLARAMNRMFASAFEDPAYYVAAPPNDAYLSGLLAQSGNIALVATVADQVIGALTAYTLPKFEQGHSEIYLYDLAVAEPHRRCGVATALISTLIGIAHDVGAGAVFVQADYGDDPAVALYTKLGTRQDVMHFDLNTDI
jgi:aminoglycoside 3-N-acetyltransferase I